MRVLLFIPFFIISALNLFAQNKSNSAQVFDKKEFEQKLALSKWLYQYDLFASHSSDSVVNEHKELYDRLGEEWFCYQDSRKIWHAIYGDFHNEKYDYVFHYEGNPNSIKQKPFPLTKDSSLIMQFARALHLTHLKFDKDFSSKVGDIHFNHYIKRNTDKTITVWYFPGFQKNDMAVYGGEVIYYLDSSASKITRFESFFQDKFTSTKIDKRTTSIVVDYTEEDAPTLGSIFFAWSYRFAFPGVAIKTRYSLSTLNYYKKQELNEFVWKHEYLSGDK